MNLMFDLLASVAKEIKIKRDLEEAESKKKAADQHHEENTDIEPVAAAMEMDYPDSFPKECRRPRSRRKILGRIRMTEEGPLVEMINDRDESEHRETNGNALSHEEVLRIERSLKKPMEYRSEDEEQVKNVEISKFYENFDHRRWRNRNGIVIREGGVQDQGRNNSQRAELPRSCLKRPLEDDNASRKQPRVKFSGSGKLLNSNQQWEETTERKKKKLKSTDIDHHGVSRKDKKFEEKSEIKFPELPKEVRDKILQKARAQGEVIDDDLKVVLVIQKALWDSDICRQQNRFTIPSNQLRNKFLTDREEDDLRGKNGRRNKSYTVPIIEPVGEVQNVTLKRWNVGNSSVSYVLNGDNWKSMVHKNKLEEGQTVQLWAFRINGNLNLAFVILPKEERKGSTGETARQRNVDEASTSQAAALISPRESENTAGDYGEEHEASKSQAAAPIFSPHENDDAQRETINIENEVAHERLETEASKSEAANPTGPDPEDDE